LGIIILALAKYNAWPDRLNLSAVAMLNIKAAKIHTIKKQLVKQSEQ
jgi:hypothetical protein